MEAAEHPPTSSPGEAICIACPNSIPASHLCMHCGHFYCRACTDWLRHISVGEDKLRSIAPLPCDGSPTGSRSDAVKNISDSESDRAKQGCHLLTAWLEDVKTRLQENGATARTRVLHTVAVIEQIVAAWRDRLLEDVDSYVTESTRQLDQIQSRFEQQQGTVCRTFTHRPVSRNVGDLSGNVGQPREDGTRALQNPPPVPELLSAEMDEALVENVTKIINSLCRLQMTTADGAFQTFLQHLDTDGDNDTLGTPENIISQSPDAPGVLKNQGATNAKEESYLHKRPQQCDAVSPRTDHLFIASADTVHIAEHLIDVHIRSEQDVETASGHRDYGVIQQVERVVVAQHSTTISIHVGDRPDLVQHVLIEQITDPRVVRAADRILVAKISWRAEKPGVTDESMEQPKHTLSAAPGQTERENNASDRKTGDLLREDKEPKDYFIRHHQDEKTEMEGKVVSFVVKVQEAHDHLVSSVLQQMEAGKLSDVVGRLFTEFNVRLMAVDCGLGFIMDVPMTQWVEVRNKQQQIQEVLSDLLPGQRWQEVEWDGIEMCEPEVGENFINSQLGQPLHIQVGKETAVAQNMPFWLEFIRHQFPGRHSRTYTIPACSADDVPINQSFLGADVKSKSAQQRALLCLEKMGETQDEAMMILGPLQFGDHFDQAPSTSAAAQVSEERLSLHRSFEDAGGFKVLLVSRLSGLIVCHMRTVGDSLGPGNYPEQRIDAIIRWNVNQAVHQLTLAENNLRHVVGHYAPGLVIRKTIGLPYITSGVFARAINGDPSLLKDLSQCLESSATAKDIIAVCLSADHLSAPDKPRDITPEILLRLKEWWVRRVAGSGLDLALTSEVYERLLARFCGPLMSVILHWVPEPRLSLALPEADDDENCVRITLTLNQMNLLHKAPPRLFVSGPPGTGKTVLLLLAAMEWLTGGHDVAVIITWSKSRAASYLLHHLLQLHVRSRSRTSRQVGTVSVVDLQVGKDKRMKTAVKRLVRLASARDKVFFMADEAGPDGKQDFQTLCLSLHAQIPGLHLWAASCEHALAPAGWQVESLHVPLRFPPEVGLAVSQASEILEGKVHGYDLTAMPRGCSWPPQKNVCHKGEGHSKQSPHDCVQCGRELASCLRILGVGFTDSGDLASVVGLKKARPTRSRHLRFKDVFILFHDTFSNSCGMLVGLRKCDVPVKMIDEHSVTDIKDVALGGSDVVRVGHWDAVRGLERRVVVFVSRFRLGAGGEAWFHRLRALSRCTEHLVCVYQL